MNLDEVRRYQLETALSRTAPPRGLRPALFAPELFKTYPGARRVNLPPPAPSRSADIASVFRNRRSRRDFRGRPISPDTLSWLIWACAGVQKSDGEGFVRRTAPSAGALYPIETYAVVHAVRGIPRGVWHYAVVDHALEQVKTGDFRGVSRAACIGQDMCGNCAVLFVFTAVFDRSTWKYGARAFRYVYLDAGHMVENLCLAATASSLGACPVGAFFDDEVNRLLDVDGHGESAIYLCAVGPC